MTIDEIMELTNQKRGTVEQFRNELQQYHLVEKHQSLDKKAFETFKKAVKYRKDLQITWSASIQRAIQEEYGENMKLPFYWTKNSILKNLIWNIDAGNVTVKKINTVNKKHDEDYHIIYEIIIPNFTDIGRTIEAYNNSYETDGNPMTTFICENKAAGYIYYLVGKYNTITGNEDMHVFYNDGPHFNIMKCTHICGGDANKGKLAELYERCVSKFSAIE